MVEMSAALRGGVERRGVFEERKAGDAGCKGGYFWEPEGARMWVEVVATEARGGGRGGETEMWKMGARVTLRKREGGVVEVRSNGEAGGRSDFGRREGMVVLGRLEEGRVMGGEAGDGACNFVCTGARRAAADVTLLTLQRGIAGAGGEVVRVAVHAREVSGRRVSWGEAVARVALLCGGVRSGMAGAVVPSGLSVDSGGVVHAAYEWGWVTVDEYARDNLVPGGNKWTEVAGEMRRRVERLLCALVGGLRAMGVLHRRGQGVGEVKLVVQPEVREGGGLLLGGLVDSGLVGPTNEELVVVGRLAGRRGHGAERLQAMDEAHRSLVRASWALKAEAKGGGRQWAEAGREGGGGAEMRRLATELEGCVRAGAEKVSAELTKGRGDGLGGMECVLRVVRGLAGVEEGMGGRCLDRALRAAREGIEGGEVEDAEMCGESVREYREERTRLRGVLEEKGASEELGTLELDGGVPKTLVRAVVAAAGYDVVVVRKNDGGGWRTWGSERGEEGEREQLWLLATGRGHCTYVGRRSASEGVSEAMRERISAELRASECGDDMLQGFRATSADEAGWRMGDDAEWMGPDVEGAWSGDYVGAKDGREVEVCARSVSGVRVGVNGTVQGSGPGGGGKWSAEEGFREVKGQGGRDEVRKAVVEAVKDGRPTVVRGGRENRGREGVCASWEAWIGGKRKGVMPSDYMGQSVPWREFWEADKVWHVALGVRSDDVGADRENEVTRWLAGGMEAGVRALAGRVEDVGGLERELGGEEGATRRTVFVHGAKPPKTGQVHYDAYSNVSVVLMGGKVLYAMDDATMRASYGARGEGGKLNERLDIDPRGDDRWSVVELGAGDVVHIPANVWHYVLSEPKTIMVGSWYGCEAGGGGSVEGGGGGRGGDRMRGRE